MTKIRVLRLITWLPKGGIERKIAALVPRLDRDLFEPHVCCIRERGPLADELEAAGIPVHLVPFRSRLHPAGLWHLRSLIRRLGIDIVHAHMYRANTPATVLRLLGGHFRVVGHYHNVDTWETWRQRRLDAFLARRRDVNLAVSEAVRRNVIERLGLAPEKIRTLHNGVDTDEFVPVDSAGRRALREELGWPTEALVVTMAARLAPQKNHRFVIENARDLLREFPHLYFVFAGDGGLEAELRELAKRAHVEDHIVFLGMRDDMPRVLAASDISILPSSREGFSNSVLESMACGLPVVASDVGGNREIIEHGINGYLLEMEHGAAGPQPRASQFVRIVRRLAGDEGLRRRIGTAARQTALQFSLSAMVARTQELYLELMQAGNRP
jgi:glycosyltransferase involved in cell wall biosynthesis